MVVVFILLGAGFLFTMNDIGTNSGAGGGSGPAVLEVYGQSIDEIEYGRRGNYTLRLATELGLSNYVNFLMIPDMDQLQMALRIGVSYYVIANTNPTRDDLNRFIANRMTLQRAMDEIGLYASDEEIVEFLKQSRNFAPNGQYDANIYQNFVNKRLGSYGMTEKHLYEVVRESICLNKLIQIIGSGLNAPRSAVQSQIEARDQSVTLSRVVYQRDDFVEKENPTEEEIKSYWETRKDAYKTEETRSISYVLINLPEEKPEPENEAKEEDTENPEEGKTEEEIEKERKEANAKTIAEKKEKSRKARTAVMRKIEDISDSIIQRINDKQELDFETIVQKHGETIVKTELFSRTSPPEALQDLSLRGNTARGQHLLDIVFQTPMANSPYDLVSKPYPVGKNAWIIFRLNEVVTPVLLDYTAARDKARAHLIGENATKKVQEATAQAREKITASMKTGKSFDDAAKELELTPVQVGPYSKNGIPPKNETNHSRLHQIASGLNPGDVSEPIHENDRSLLIFLEKREIEDNEQTKRMVDIVVTNSATELMIFTFINWRNAQFEKAKISGLFTQN